MKSVKTIMVMAIIVILTLTACNTEKPAPTNSNAIPNPATSFCKENGGTSEMRQAADGSVTGFCLFSDGSECDEWAYFRGECGMGTLENPKFNQTKEPAPNASGGYMQPGTSEPIEDWWGVIKSTEPGAQYDDYFERQDLGGAIYFGIDAMVLEVKSQIESLRDSGKIVHLYGTLLNNVPDYNGSQVLIDRIEVETKE